MPYIYTYRELPFTSPVMQCAPLALLSLPRINYCADTVILAKIPSNSIVIWSVTMPDVALLVTEYWYTPGSLPVTVSVLI